MLRTQFLILLVIGALIVRSSSAAPVAREWDWKYWLNACQSDVSTYSALPAATKNQHRQHGGLLNSPLVVGKRAAASALQLWDQSAARTPLINNVISEADAATTAKSSDKARDLFRAVMEYAASVERMSTSLKVAKLVGFGTPESQIDNFEWESLPVVPDASPAAFIQASSDPQSGAVDLSQNVATVVQYTYHMLQSLASHLAQSHRDQQMRRDVSATQTEMFERLNFGQDGMRALLCALRMVMEQVGIAPDRATEQQLGAREITSLNDPNLLTVRDVLILNRIHDAAVFTKKLADLVLTPGVWQTFIGDLRRTSVM